MKIITVTATGTGGINVEAHGFKGQGCKALTEAIGSDLGAKSGSVIKGDYHEPEQENLGGVEVGCG